MVTPAAARWPPKRRSRSRHSASARVQIERGDRAARALPLLSVERDEQRRAPELLDEPRRDDADHAGMPALLGEHDAVRGIEIERADELARACERRAVDLLPVRD